MAITVTPNDAYYSNSGYLLTEVTGVSSTNGTAEDFEFTFNCADGDALIIVKNGTVATASAVLQAAKAGNGFNPTATTIPTGRTCVFRIESFYVKAASGKITLRVTPGTSTTVSGSGIKVSAVSSGVKAH